MRVIADTKFVEVGIEKDLIFTDNGKRYVCVQIVSDLLKKKEEADNLEHKSLRIRLYNSLHCEKYNVLDAFGMKWIDIDNPMKSKASLELNFKEV